MNFKQFYKSDSKINIKKWMGDSGVVDKDGNPILVFHGTDIKQFDKFKTPAFFTTDYELAEDRAKTRQRGRERVIACYIRNAKVESWIDKDTVQYIVNNPNDILIIDQDYEIPNE